MSVLVPGSEERVPAGGAEGRGSTAPPLLSGADADVLAAAIAKAMKPAPPTRADVSFGALRVVVAFATLAAFWFALHAWYPEAPASYSGDVTATLSGLTLGGAGSGASFTVPAAYARDVELSGPGSSEDVLFLPVAKAACRAPALIALGCSGGVLSDPLQWSVHWNTPEDVFLSTPGSASSAGTAASALDVQTQPSGGARNASCPPVPGGVGGARVCIEPAGAGRVSWCTLAAPRDGDIVIAPHDGVDTKIPPRYVGDHPCGDDLELLVDPPTGLAGQAPSTTFGGISSLLLSARSGQVTASRVGGVLYLGGDGSDAIAPASPLALSGAAGSVHVELSVAPSDTGSVTELELTSSRVSSASAGGPSLVTSWWDRESAIAVPLFLALSGASFNLVLPFLDLVRKRRRALRDIAHTEGSP